MSVRQLYVEDVAEFYGIYATVKKLMGEEPEGLVAGVKELLKFYNALQVRYEGERILYSDDIWKRFEQAEQELEQQLPDNLPDNLPEQNGAYNR